MRVVGCVPVPNARPGSSRITWRAPAGDLGPGRHDPEVGVISAGPELRLRQTNPVLLGDGRDRDDVQPSVVLRRPRPPLRSRRRRRRRARCTRERCQPDGGGTPGSSKTGCSASLPASASSIATESASSSCARTSLTAVDRRSTERGARGRASRALSACVGRASLPGSGCSSRLRRTWRRPSARGAAGCWSGCLRRPSPRAPSACAPAPARGCRRGR